MSQPLLKATARGVALAVAPDAALFEAIASGEMSPLGELFDRYHESVRAFAERALRSRADAADLVQETFLTASRAVGAFEPGAPAKPFLLGIAAQLVRRRRRSFARLRSMLDAFAREPIQHTTPEQTTIETEEGALFDAALARLSHSRREVLLLVDLGGLSGVEAARALGIPAGTVWRRLHEARADLRAAINRRIK